MLPSKPELVCFAQVFPALTRCDLAYHRLSAVLWLASVLMDLKGKSFDVASLADDKVQTGVAALATYFAFA